MKKWIAIVIALLLLTIFIGMERMSRTERSAMAKDPTQRLRTSGVRAVEDSGDCEAIANDQSLPKEQAGAARYSKSSDAMPERADPDRSVSLAERGAIDVSGNFSSVYWIRSTQIVRATVNLDADLERLRRTMQLLGDEMVPHALIFDADGLATTQFPIVIYARKELDLTEPAKLIYNRLLVEDESAENAGNVLQKKVADSDASFREDE